MPYQAAVSEFQFLFDHVVDFDRVAATEKFAEATPDLVSAILTEAGRLCDEVLAPVQRGGDLHPATLENGVVRTSPGYDVAYRAIADGGWLLSTSARVENGGMGLPLTVTAAVNEMMAGACLSMALNPLMTQGQIEALEHHASDALKAIYLPKLISGEWCGTMNLTEAQAGSDVGALSSKAVDNKAVDNGDGTFAVSGTKIFISWGDSDFSGTKGISLFLVPKYLPDAAGDSGAANTLSVVSLEHKLGLHGSPTAVMQFDGAKGWLVGAAGAGMKAMFTMMNNARLGVAGQGIGEGAYQHALAFAMERKQGRSPIEGGNGTIIDHADVRRMLATMKADLFAARAIAMACGVAIDMGTATGDVEWQARAAFLTPIAKAFGTDTGIQVHGGMGFIDETGAAQYARDVRVTAIYGGTNGIQSMDLVARKLMDGGDAACRLLDEIEAAAEAARAEYPELAEAVWQANENLREATEWMVTQEHLNQRFAGSVPYLRAFARVLGGHFHLKAAMSEGGGENGKRTKLARFYILRLLDEVTGLLTHATAGADDLYALSDADLGA
jgi:alkylation response protein AidB-like acyl-CoA dehydrogenase